MTASRKDTRQSGFTLLEMLVALVVLGFLVLGLAQGVRTGLALWAAQNRRMSETGELDSVARVEVMRGSGSTLYGSDAVGGVVNIITEPPPDTELRLRTAVGNFGINQQQAGLVWSDGFQCVRIHNLHGDSRQGMADASSLCAHLPERGGAKIGGVHGDCGRTFRAAVAFMRADAEVFFEGLRNAIRQFLCAHQHIAQSRKCRARARGSGGDLRIRCAYACRSGRATMVKS